MSFTWLYWAFTVQAVGESVIHSATPRKLPYSRVDAVKVNFTLRRPARHSWTWLQRIGFTCTRLLRCSTVKVDLGPPQGC